MNLFEKLLFIQTDIEAFVKDNTVGEGRQQYKAVSSEQVLNRVRPLLNEQKLLLIPTVTGAHVIEGQTSSGTARYLTELTMVMTWHDVESGEERPCPWYAQGVDLAGEKGVGKANTYAEKYFLMKFFHVPTPADDPDKDPRTKSGELRQRGTQADKENTVFYRKAIPQMLNELYGSDAEKLKPAYIALTESQKRGYPGVDNIDAIHDAALAVVYGKLKPQYEKRVGHEFKLAEEQEDTECR